MVVTVFTQRNFVADFIQAKCDFRRTDRLILNVDTETLTNMTGMEHSSKNHADPAVSE